MDIISIKLEILNEKLKDKLQNANKKLKDLIMYIIK